MQESVCIAAGSGQLTKLLTLICSMSSAGLNHAQLQSVCVCLLEEGKREGETCKAASVLAQQH